MQSSSTDIRDALPPLGLREFWYPVGRSREFRRRPVGIKLLGTEIVFFRDDGKVYALFDRCPHRGLPLSCGRRRFAGTISCRYHGWTFNGSGDCVAALNEGPVSPLPGKVRVRSYPVEERNGIVWVFMGDGPPKSLDEDIPGELLDARSIVNFQITAWKCGWLAALENLFDSHEVIVHRDALIFFFRKMPSWVRVGASESADGKGIDVRHDAVGPVHDTYPTVGRWPRRTWHRQLGVYSGTPGMDLTIQLRLPGIVRFGFSRMMYHRWVVPTDETSVRVFIFATSSARGWQALRHRLSYRLWISWSFMKAVVNQDKVIFERQDYWGPEHLSQTDVGVIKWRKLLAATAHHESSAQVTPR